MRAKDLARNIRKGETLFPLFLFLLVGVVFVNSLQAPPRPMLLPRAIQLLLLLLLAVQIARSLLAKSSGAEPSAQQRREARRADLKMVITFIVMLLIPLSVYLIGFLVTGCLYVAVTILYWGGRKIRDLVIAEAILVALIYGVFQRLLLISFPAGILFGG